MDKVPCPNITAHNIKGDSSSLRFVIHIACWPINVEVRLNRPLNNGVDISPLVQIILHEEPLLRPGVWPLTTVHHGKVVGLLPVLEVVATEVIVQPLLPGRLSLMIEFMDLRE